MTTNYRSLTPLLDQYSIRIGNVVPLTANRFLVQSERRVYAATFASIASAAMRLAVADFSAFQGYRRVERAVESLYGERILNTPETVAFMLSDCGPSSVSTSIAKVPLSDLVHELCELHRALEHAGPTVWRARPDGMTLGVNEATRYRAWLQVWASAINAFAAERLLLSQRQQGPDGLAIWLRRWERIARAVYESCLKQGIDEMLAASAAEGSIAWGGVRQSSWLVHAGGHGRFAQTADPVYAPAWHDMITLIQWLDSDVSLVTRRSLIDEYVDVRRLATGTASVLVSASVFPVNAWHWIRLRRSASYTTSIIDSGGWPADWRAIAERDYLTACEALSIRQ